MPDWLKDEALWQKALYGVITLALAWLLAWLLTRLLRFFFKRAQKRGKKLHLAFLEKLLRIFIYVFVLLLAASGLNGAQTLLNVLLGGTAILSAVLAFVAQDSIKDVLAGLMISIYHPFDIGDRIELEDGTVGGVEDITLRHTVLAGLDGMKTIVPNSKLNALLVKNYSFHSDKLSAQFRFSVGYDTDLELAKRLIADAVRDCPYTVPKDADEYSPVYFLSFADSALILTVTAFFPRSANGALVIDDINERVRTALVENGVEIPYNYVTVVNK